MDACIHASPHEQAFRLLSALLIVRVPFESSTTMQARLSGQWTPEEASRLLTEFDLIETAFSNAPPMAFNADWKKRVAKDAGIDPKSLLDCFFDIDGEALIERLRGLAKVSIESDVPILFQ